MNPINSPRRLLLVAMALGWSVDLLFYGKPLGLSALIFVLLFLGALHMLGRGEDVQPVPRNLWLSVPLIFFAGMIGVRADRFLTALNWVACVLLMALVVYFYAAGRVERMGLLGYWIAVMVAFVYSLVLAAPLVPRSVNMATIRRRGLRPAVPIMRGFILALPVLVVFSCLLASADVVFASYLRDVMSIDLYLLGAFELLFRLILVMVAAWLISGALAYAISRRTPSEEEPWEQAMSEIPRSASIGFVEAITVLVLVDLLFFSFVWVQFAYLFGGQSNITVDGFTYAEYARRGFFEIVTVSVLTMGLILGLNWLARRENPRREGIFRSLFSLMIGLVMVLLGSAFLRMLLYEQAYGYTHLRLYVHIFELWLVAAFVWLFVTLWSRRVRFAVGGLGAMLGFLLTLNLINPDAVIVEQNMARYRETGKLDVVYLIGMSEDATPALLENLDALGQEERAALLRHLGYRLKRLEESSTLRDAPQYNLSRGVAYALLSRQLRAPEDVK